MKTTNPPAAPAYDARADAMRGLPATTTAHTPGPWKALPGEGDYKYMTTIQNRCGLGIARCVPCDASLIASAPDLLAALEAAQLALADAVPCIEDALDDPTNAPMARRGIIERAQRARKALDQTDAAIARAKGV